MASPPANITVALIKFSGRLYRCNFHNNMEASNVADFRTLIGSAGLAKYDNRHMEWLRVMERGVVRRRASLF